jgi:hypothetical protein
MIPETECEAGIALEKVRMVKANHCAVKRTFAALMRCDLHCKLVSLVGALEKYLENVVI